MDEVSKNRFFLYKKYRFSLHPGVIPPRFGSLMLAEHLPGLVDKKDFVLDLGTGTGILGIIAAKKAQRVIAGDISPESIRLTRENAAMNGVGKRVFGLVSDMFSAIRKNLFDMIIGNVPMMPAPPGSPEGLLSKARDGGSDGRYFLDRMIREAPGYLKPHGRLLFQQFDFLDVKKTLQKMEQAGFESKIIDEKIQILSQTGMSRVEYLKSLGTDSLIHEKSDASRCKRLIILGKLVS
jgi:release factor glutamine methyltransferase